jgi:hypothetical protein
MSLLMFKPFGDGGITVLGQYVHLPAALGSLRT